MSKNKQSVGERKRDLRKLKTRHMHTIATYKKHIRRYTHQISILETEILSIKEEMNSLEPEDE